MGRNSWEFSRRTWFTVVTTWGNSQKEKRKERRSNAWRRAASGFKTEWEVRETEQSKYFFRLNSIGKLSWVICQTGLVNLKLSFKKKKRSRRKVWTARVSPLAFGGGLSRSLCVNALGFSLFPKWQERRNCSSYPLNPLGHIHTHTHAHATNSESCAS